MACDLHTSLHLLKHPLDQVWRQADRGFIQQQTARSPQNRQRQSQHLLLSAAQAAGAGGAAFIQNGEQPPDVGNVEHRSGPDVARRHHVDVFRHAEIGKDAAPFGQQPQTESDPLGDAQPVDWLAHPA